MNTMTMTIYQYQFEAKKVLRILLVAAVLIVGNLGVTQCSNDNTYDDHERLAQEVERLR